MFVYESNKLYTTYEFWSLRTLMFNNLYLHNPRDECRELITSSLEKPNIKSQSEDLNRFRKILN